MAIDIRNINEITFSQSFRGYNTDEVDDFLDDIYDEAVNNNKEIQELKKRIEELESGAPAMPEPNDGNSQEEAYAIIANAQMEADRIIEAARQKAHALILQAEKIQAEKAAASAPMASTQPSSQINDVTVDRLRQTLREMYQKQLAVLDDMSSPAQNSVYKAPSTIANQPLQASPEPPARQTPPVRQAELVKEDNDIPSISFSGITRRVSPKIPADRDILGEIDAINLGENTFKKQQEADIQPPAYEPMDIGDTQPFEKTHEPEPESSGISFAFEMPDDEDDEVEQPQQQPSSFNEVQAEDPDDIIAQILRDNNRN